MKRFVLASIGLALAVQVTVPVRAGGRSAPFQETHPYVGFAVFGSGGAASHVCSGALVSPTIFLTAGSCTEGADIALVWFEEGVTLRSSSAAIGTPQTHPAFNGYPDGSDLGVVVLEEAIDLPVYAVLPALGLLDAFETRRTLGDEGFTVVDYRPETVVPFFQDEYVRYRSTPTAVQLGGLPTDGFSIHLTIPVADRDFQHACFGLAGGPAFVGTSNVVAAVASFATDGACVGGGFYYRVDSESAQEFIQSFLR